MSVLPVGIGSEAGGYQIERSLRFNSADSAYLNRTFSTPTAGTKWTWSAWIKRSALYATKNYQTLFGTQGSGAQGALAFGQNGSDELSFKYSGFFRRFSTGLFRDTSAWYHIVVAVDTTQATEANRALLYVNGQTFTWTTSTNITQNDTTQINQNVAHNLGSNSGAGSNEYFDGYMAEVHFIDGQALTPSSFGEFDTDTGVWKPKAYSGSYGTNGFYLDFSDNSSTTALGYDAAGSNDWTPNNFSVTAGAGNDSLVDSPTRYGTDTGVGGEVRGNYATWNPINGVTASLTNGNLDLTYSSAGGAVSTMAFPSTGKWYWEVTVTGGGNNRIGICLSSLSGTDSYNTVTGTYVYNGLNGQKYTSGTGAAYGATFTTNDVIGVAVDADAGTVVFYKNNSSQGTAFSGLNFATSSYSPTISVAGSGTSMVTNFGARPFVYTAPSNHKALCTTNLPEPTIAEGSQYFDINLSAATGATRTVSGFSFQPDLVISKNRTYSTNGRWGYIDAVRGVNKTLASNDPVGTSAEVTSQTDLLTAFNSDGFTLGADAGGYGWNYNQGGNSNYAYWAWKANGSGVLNEVGTIDSTVSANTTSGFSIATFTMPSSGTSDTVGHGLGVQPAMVIVKARGSSSSWGVYHKNLTSAAYYLTLQTTNGETSSNNWWNSTAPTSSVFTLGATWYGSGTTVAYAFSPVEGFSAFGSYVGNGDPNGPFVYTGFRPRWIMIKVSSTSGYNWVVVDTARNIYNPQDLNLYPNLSAAEDDYTSTYPFDILSNGFKLKANYGNMNLSGATIIYAAFAENPFKYALAR